MKLKLARERIAKRFHIVAVEYCKGRNTEIAFHFHSSVLKGNEL
jgi:hypothetical protein